MKRITVFVALALTVWAATAMAVNTVVIPSQSVAKGATGVAIPVMLTNDVQLKGITMPFVLREVTPGAFVTSITMGFGDRLPLGSDPLNFITFRNQYAEEDGSCKQGLVGGFATITSATGGPNPVVASPEGVMFVRQALLSGFLNAGADVTGSLKLTVDVTSVDGTFEIDTTCANPASHLLYILVNNTGVVPAFTKSIITIGNPVTNHPPDAVCQNVNVNADADCLVDVPASSVNNGSSDPDPGDVITLALHPPGPYGAGPHSVWLVVSDLLLEKDSCQATITVTDVTPPQITSCPGNVTVSCPANVPPVNTGAVLATDNCGVVVTHRGDVSDGLSCPETITRTYRATDGAGLFVECIQTITVDDIQDPVITVCPAPVTVACVADVPAANIGSVTATDNCGSPTITHVGDGPLTGGPCGGTITRTYRATDACGNYVECQQTITVNDTEPPDLVSSVSNLNLACPGQVPPCLPSDVTFTDNCGVPDVVADRIDNGGVGNAADPLIITDTYIATDDCGNTSQVGRIITVVDDTPPAPQCPGNIVELVAPGTLETVVTYVSTFTDNCAGGAVDCVPASGSLFPLGLTTVTCTATDAVGNTDICTFTVTVTNQTEPPVAICVDVTVDADANCEADASIDDGSYDPDGGAVTLTQDPPGPYPLGPTTVQLTVTDNEGDESMCSAVVTVVDNTPPVTTCSGDIDVSIPTGAPGAIVDFVSTVDDNCPGATVSCDPPSGSLFPAGQTTVTCTGMDASGNTSECSFLVTVNEIFTNPPVAVDDHKTTRGGAILYVVGVGVLVNDYDIDGDPLTAILNTDVAIGALTLNPDGSFLYTAPADYVGPVEFTYFANDGLVNSAAPATVFINVKPNMFVGDFDEDGYLTALDLGAEIDALFAGGPNPRSLECHTSCADFDCSGFPDITDLGKMVDHLFAGAPGPCDPCDH